MRSLLYLVAVLHEPMGTVAQVMLEAIRYGPLDGDAIAQHLGVTQRQTVNQAARKLEAAGRLRRNVGPEGKIINEMVEGSSFSAPMPRGVVAGSVLAEDEVKTAVAPAAKVKAGRRPPARHRP
jgi:hypothetical protein